LLKIKILGTILFTQKTGQCIIWPIKKRSNKALIISSTTFDIWIIVSYCWELLDNWNLSLFGLLRELGLINFWHLNILGRNGKLFKNWYTFNTIQNFSKQNIQQFSSKFAPMQWDGRDRMSLRTKPIDTFNCLFLCRRF
jgi:hypothetical protein